MLFPPEKPVGFFDFAEEVGDLDDVSYSHFEDEVALNEVGCVVCFRGKLLVFLMLRSRN